MPERDKRSALAMAIPDASRVIAAIYQISPEVAHAPHQCWVAPRPPVGRPLATLLIRSSTKLFPRARPPQCYLSQSRQRWGPRESAILRRQKAKHDEITTCPRAPRAPPRWRQPQSRRRSRDKWFVHRVSTRLGGHGRPESKALATRTLQTASFRALALVIPSSMQLPGCFVGRRQLLDEDLLRNAERVQVD
jgi:hypothetical protein